MQIISFYAGDATKSNYFRIPSLLTLDSGTVIAAADARYGGTHDSKSKINTAFAKSTDGGNTWGEPTLPMKFDDYVAKNIDWPRDSVGKNVQIQGSASYIDPVLLEDKSTHRVFLFADLMPAALEVLMHLLVLDFKEINGKKNILKITLERRFRLVITIIQIREKWYYFMMIQQMHQQNIV